MQVRILLPVQRCRKEDILRLYVLGEHCSNASGGFETRIEIANFLTVALSWSVRLTVQDTGLSTPE